MRSKLNDAGWTSPRARRKTPTHGGGFGPLRASSIFAPFATAFRHSFRSCLRRVRSRSPIGTPCSIPGATAEELQGRALTESVHPDDLPNVMAAWGRSIPACRPYSVEARRRRVDGVYRWFEMHGFPLQDAGGRVACWYVHDRDIDDQKRAEALLAGEKQFLEMVASGCSMPAILHALCQLIENTVDGCRASVLLVDPTGTHLGKNRRGAELAARLRRRTQGPYFRCHLGPVRSGRPLERAGHRRQHRVGTALDVLSRSSPRLWCARVLVDTDHVKRRQGTGRFGVTHDHPRTPTPQDLNLVEQLKHIASIAIERTLNDAALRRSEACLAGDRG